MMNEENSLPEFEKLLKSNDTTKKDLDDFAWLLEHPEYEHRMVDIGTFIDSPDYLNASKECWPSVKDDLVELFSGNYTEAVFCEAIGAGKSFKSSVIIVYQVYRVLCLKNPQEFFTLAPGSGFWFINMSLTAGQSRKVVFGEIKGRIDNSPWFQRYCPPDPDIRSELRFTKGVTIVPGNSQDTFPLGFNVFGGVMDEAAFYIQTKDHDSAENMFNALHNRIKNRFGEQGLLVMISSPRYVDDFIERKMQEAKTNKKIFSKRKMLWESKPSSSFCGERFEFDGHMVPIEFEAEAKRNPEMFKRDFMALPSLALEPYVKQWDLVKACVDETLQHPVDVNGQFAPWFKGNSKFLYYAHIDLSLSRDATGFAIAHNEGNMVIVDLMLRITPPPNGEISFAEIREMILDLKKNRGFRFGKVTYDGFQSQDSIQILRKNYIRSETFSLDKDTAGYDTLKERIYEGQIRYYNYEPFFDELRRLELVEGKKVDHPPKGSKDVADAVAGAVFHAARQARRGFATGEIL